MRANGPLLWGVVFVLTLCASDLLAQKEFDEAHGKIAAFWSETSNPRKDPEQKAKVAKDFNELTGKLRPLIDAGILSYLNSSHAISPDELTIKVAKSLVFPYGSVNGLADTDGNVSVVPVPHRNGYAIAYNISTCASCSTSWVRIATRREDHWVMTDHLDNPEKDNAVHLAWVGSKAEPLLALYGIHWGDAHNRLDVRLYSLKDGFKEIWSALDLPQGTIAIEANQFTLTSWTAMLAPYRVKHQAFQVDGVQIKPLEPTFSAAE